ncbi:MAG TPA: hypothetical protein VLH19_03085, partial [Patescibacteria group bacterium]|nr:hypothetical protein [Patescibacteria group bacterium]
GLALMTKTPALFAIPIFAIVPLFFLKKFNLRPFMYILLGGLLAGLLFLSLRVSPLFGSLFARENDFTFSLRDLLTGQWHYVVSTSIWRNLYWIASYVTPGWLVLAVSGLFFIRTKKNVLLLLLSAVIFAAPLTILGRVLYPRYFLPVVPFLTIAGAIGLGELLQTTKYRFFGWLLAAFALLGAMQFIIPSFADIAHIPFVMEDKIQYLSEWSAGFGNSEVRDFVINEQKKLPSDGSEKIIVLTEGAFGTLPDGLLMYFHEPGSAKNLEIHGIGVGPSVIPQEYLDRARTNEVFYMVNSHRFKVADPSILQKVFEVPRPLNGPKLVLYRVL